MPVEHSAGGTTITGNATLGFRGQVALSAMRIYLDTGMQASRIATPSNLRAIATEFTGKQYARSRKGLEKAYADLSALAESKSLDELGETSIVNREVGGVAADLAD